MAEVVGLVASVAGIADISFKIIGIVKEYVGEVRGAKDDIRNLVTELSECYMVAKEMKKLTDDPKAKALLSSRELAPTIEITLATLKRLQTELEASSKTSLSSFKWPLVKKSVEACVKPLARTVEKVRDMMQVDQTRLLLNAEHRIVIDKLQVAEGAAFNSHAQEHSTACFPDTRVELLEQIYQWIEGTYSRAVFWLNGMAGTGKSTISQRIARSQSAAGQLGATFFFKRGEEDRSSLDKFMSTLAQQLAHHIPGVGPLIKAAIDEDPTIGGKLIQQQFDRLIIEPLASLLASDTDTIPARIVFVVDALDECGKDEDIRLLIQVITSATNLPSRLRFFLTSRPALPVLGSFREAKEAHHVLILHDIQESIVEHDLEVFFRVQFGSIRSSFNAASDSNKLPDDWPGDNTVRELVSRSKPLFIFAATLCRYVRNRKGGNPKALLARYLESKATGSHLSQMYHHILKSQLDDDEPSLKPDIINDFILVVGSIVILAEPLGMKSLVSLLGDKHRDTVSDRLRQLHSVLRVPPDDSPMRLLHLSFGDYLLGRDSQTEEARLFHVEQDHAHRTVAKKSIRLMRKCPLRQNIAVLSFPGMKTSDVDPQQLATAIPPALRYACRYWIHHWTSSHFHEQHGALIHDFLKVHLLHWWEAMSLLGHLREAMNALRSLLSWIQPSHSLSEILELLTDVIRFLRSNFYVMEHTPLQIYSSALALSPANSIVKRSFASCISSWLTLQPPVRKSWNACLAVLECQGGLHSMAFSRNSRRLAGASYSSIYVRDVDTGECKATLVLGMEGSEVFWPFGAIAFSHDSELVAASNGSTIEVWMVQTGQRLRKLENYRWKTSGKAQSETYNLFFTNDSKSLFSDSNGDIRLWDLTSGTCTVVLESPNDFKHGFVNCHIQDLKPLVLSRNGSVCRIWNITQFGPTAQAPGLGVRLEGSIPPERAVAASHNHARIVIVFFDSTICCWDAKTGGLLNKLPADDAIWVSVTFCGHSQKLIAAASKEGHVCFWIVDTGQVLKKLIGHRMIRQLVCSPDGGFLATCWMHHVTIWNLNELRHQDAPTRLKHLKDPNSLVFCHEARVLASSSIDGSVHVWDAETGNAEEIPKGHPLPQVLDKLRPGSTTFGHLWELLGETQGRICIPEAFNVSAVKFSKDSANFARASCGEGPLRIQLWNARTQTRLQTMENFGGPQHSVRAMFLSEDSTRLAAIIRDQVQTGMMVWDCLSGVCMRDVLYEESSIDSAEDFINSAIFLPSGKKLVLALDSLIRVWDLETGEGQFLQPPKKKYPSELWHVALAASSDSKRLVSASMFNEIWIWNLETGYCIAFLETSTRLLEISLLPGDGGLVTNAGIIPIDINAAGPFQLKAEFKGLGYSDEGWITWDGKPWFWLPRQYRRAPEDGPVQVQGNRIAIGCESGQVVFFGIDGGMGFEHGTNV